MAKVFLGVATALLVGMATSAFATDAGDQILLKVGEKYAASKRLKASFRQEVPLASVGVVRKATGTVTFERPLRMRWDYVKPTGQIFLSDGEHYWFRPSDSPRVYRRKVDESTLGGKIPLLLLFGDGRISDLFRVEESSLRAGGAETLLRLVPKGDGAPEVRRVDLVVKTADLSVREVHLYDRLGGVNRIFLDAVVVDPAVPAGFFRFKAPEGTEVVDG